MEKIRISFRRHKKETGLRGIGYPWPQVSIKVNGKEVGNIFPKTWNTEYWRVGFTVKKLEPDDNPNCDWKWIWLKQKGNSEEEAREIAIKAIPILLQKYTFHTIEE